MKLIKFVFSLTFTIVLIGILNRPMMGAPSLGEFLNPQRGFWRNSEKKIIQLPSEIEIEGLQEDVSIKFDELLIPHITAKNDYDLYFAQGYVTAYHRLWQMDFYSRVVMGRVSEIVGERALEFDRLQRRIGLKDMTLKFHEELMRNDELSVLVIAYTNGVNKYLSTLDPGDYPIEFKLLNYGPEEWTTLKTCMAYALLSSTLSRGESDLENTNARELFGDKMFGLLFPENSSNIDPVIPKDTEFNFSPTSIPQIPDVLQPGNSIKTTISKQNPLNGSNNFAIDGTKSKSGHSLLANEPDLELTLPSIWYASHLTSPTMNVMGVTVPGTPVILIGFNDSIAWGVTNSPRDQVDWYAVNFKDSLRKEYRYNNQWFKTEMVIEHFVVKDAESFNDTIIKVHQGPVVYDRNFLGDNMKANYAMRWIAHDQATTFKAMFQFNKAKNYSDFEEALRYFTGPPQNVIFSDTKGNIALNLPGKFPVKWPGQGKFLQDGSDPRTEWTSYIPFEHRLQVFNHPQGFLSSANQFPVDPGTYPYYIYANSYEYYRNRRINDRLERMNNITPQDLMNLQNDNFNYIASEILPFILAKIDTNSLLNEEIIFFNELVKWDYFNEPSLNAPSNFELWYDILFKELWDEFDTISISIDKPNVYTTSLLIKTDSLLPFYDRLSTPQTESLPDLLRLTFKLAVDSLESWKKENDKDESWANFKGTDINHLINQFSSFSVHNVNIGGNHNIVNAASKRHGPSWRMIVDMDSSGVKAYGVYPGSQTGNPGNTSYGQMIKPWAEGRYFELNFGGNPLLAEEIIYELQLTTKK